LSDGAEAAGGPITPVGDTFVERMIGRANVPPAAEIDPATYLPTSSSLAFTKTSWEAAGGYPEWLDNGERAVFAVTLREASPSFVFVPTAHASWNPRQNLREYLRSSYRESRSHAKARVFDRGQAVRLLGYLGCAVGLTGLRRSPIAKIIAGASFWIVSQPQLRWLWRTRGEGPDALPSSIVGVLIVRVGGDLARFVGFGRGLWAGVRQTDRIDR
jgi:hypothetical protein